MTHDNRNKKLWKNTNLLLLLQGHFVSRLGTNIFDIALVLWIKETMDMASIMSLILIASNIPEIVLAPIGGTLADRVSRKWLLVISDLISGVTVIALSIAFFLMATPSVIHLSLLFAASTILGICSAAFNPTVSAFIPDLVDNDKLHQANAAYQMANRSGALLGQGASGWLFVVLGAPWLFLLNGVSFIVSAISETWIRQPQAEQKLNKSKRTTYADFKREMKQGFDYTWRNPKFRDVMIVIGIFHFFVAPLALLLPFLVRDTLKISSIWIGFLMAGFGGGTMIGFTIAGALALSGDKNRRFVSMNILASPFLFICVGLFRTPFALLIVMILIGVIIGIIVVNLETLMQKRSPADMRGRLFGFLNTVMNASFPLGYAVYGVAIDLLRKNLENPDASAPLIFVVNGGILLISMLWILKNREFRQFLSE